MDLPTLVLPTPGGPTRQTYGTLGVLLELADGQVLDDAVLDVLQAVMVVFEDLPGLLHVEISVCGPRSTGRLLIVSS